MWDKRNRAKAADPLINTYAKEHGASEGKPDDDKQPAVYNAKPCPPPPPDCRLKDAHPYINTTPTNNPTVRGANRLRVSEQFGTLLQDCPILKGTAQPNMDRDQSPYPWPHANLYRAGFSVGNEEGVEEEDEGEAKKGGVATGSDFDYYMLPNQGQSSNITKFHNFCLKLPDVMCNYCSIPLYPEDICWVGLDSPEEG